jgi:hypothetical protein
VGPSAGARVYYRGAKEKPKNAVLWTPNHREPWRAGWALLARLRRPGQVIVAAADLGTSKQQVRDL